MGSTAKSQASQTGITNSKWHHGNESATQQAGQGETYSHSSQATTISRISPAAWLKLHHTFAILPVSQLIQRLSGMLHILPSDSGVCDWCCCSIPCSDFASSMPCAGHSWLQPIVWESVQCSWTRSLRPHQILSPTCWMLPCCELWYHDWNCRDIAFDIGYNSICSDHLLESKPFFYM